MATGDPFKLVPELWAAEIKSKHLAGLLATKGAAYDAARTDGPDESNRIIRDLKTLANYFNTERYPIDKRVAHLSDSDWDALVPALGSVTRYMMSDGSLALYGVKVVRAEPETF